jgi:YozE SAM-like fold
VTFFEFLKQQIDRDDDIGYVARYVDGDDDAPRGRTADLKVWKAYLDGKNAPLELLLHLEEAWKEYGGTWIK